MATLVVYQGETIDREVELGEHTLRVGRGDDNELVLSDPIKSVSRHHAELRFEQGKYSIVDLQSQNGVWIAGRRVSTAELEPGIPVVVGSYRLMLKAPQTPLASEATILAPASGVGAATILITPSANPHALAAARAAASTPEASAPKPAPVAKVPEARAPEAPPKPEPPVAVAKPTPPPPSAPAPVPTPAVVAAKPAEPPTSEKVKASGKGMSKGVVLAIAALLVLAAGAGVAVMMLRNRGARPVETAAAAVPATPPTTPPPPVETPPPPAVAEATPPPAPETPAEPAKPKASPAEKAPGTVASDARGRAATPKPAAPVGTRGRRGGPIPPTQTIAAEKPVIPNLTGMFEEARTAMIKGDYLAAISGFENVLKYDPNYPNAANLLDVARGGARNASQLAVDAGNKAEMSADYVGAMKQYQRALQLDEKSTSAPDAISRLKVRMQREGEASFASAKQYDAGDRTKEAIAAYERALQLLPADHPSVPAAKDRLAALKR